MARGLKTPNGQVVHAVKPLSPFKFDIGQVACFSLLGYSAGEYGAWSGRFVGDDGRKLRAAAPPFLNPRARNTRPLRPHQFADNPTLAHVIDPIVSTPLEKLDRDRYRAAPCLIVGVAFESLTVSETIHPAAFSEEAYAREITAQRLVAGSRVVLAVAALLVGGLKPATFDPGDASPFGLLAAYLAYALLVAALVGFSKTPVKLNRSLTQGVDLVVLTVLQTVSHGVASPFFFFYPFLLFAAALECPGPGFGWVAALALGSFFGLPVFGLLSAVPQPMEIDRFLMRSGALLLWAGLMGRLCAYERDRRRDLARLAEWPATMAFPPHFPDALDPLLAHAATVVQAQRVLMFWQNSDGTRLDLAVYENGRMRMVRHGISSMRSLVAEALAEADFLCSWFGAGQVLVVNHASRVFEPWRGAPIDDKLRIQFAIRDLLSVHVRGPGFTGRLMFLDTPGANAERLLLARMVGSQLGALLSRLFAVNSLAESAATGARVRMADDLHDGVMQSLTGVRFALEQLRPALLGDAAAELLLEEIQATLAEEQRLLRLLILNPGRGRTDKADGGAFQLERQLNTMASTLEKQYGVILYWVAEPEWPAVPDEMARQLYFLLHETVMNSVRHANAQTVMITLQRDPEARLGIVVEDRGTGFPFRGRRSLEQLEGMARAPKSLMRRVVNLGGRLSIESGSNGARIEVSIPMALNDNHNSGAEGTLSSPTPAATGEACADKSGNR